MLYASLEISPVVLEMKMKMFTTSARNKLCNDMNANEAMFACNDCHPDAKCNVT